MRKEAHLHIKLEQALLDALAVRAAQAERSVSAEARLALRQYVDTQRAAA